MQAERKKISSEMAKRARKITESEIHIDIENSPNEGVKYKTEPVKQPENIDVSNIQEEDELSIDNSWLLVLEVIGYMCDGQHRTLQNYLRHQPDNFKTVNVVAEVTALLHTYTTELTLDNSEALNKILQALIEMCVGNVSNQTVIFDKLVIEPLNRILQYKLGEDTPCGSCIIPDKQCEKCTNMVDLVSIKGRAIELISVMIENISPETDNIIQGIGPTIDVQAVIETMCMFHELKSNELIEKKEMDDDCERGMFRSYHTLVSLMECKAIPYHDRNELLKECNDETKRVENIEDECHSTTRTIEIKYQGDDDDQSKPELARVHFPYDSKNNIREAIRDKVSWSINRDSMEDKQRSLLDVMPALKKDVRHQALLKSTKILKPFLAFHKWRARLLLLLTIILNIIVLAVFKVPPQYIVPNGPSDNNTVFLPETEVWFYPYLLFVLGAIHLIMTLWIVIEYFLINFPHFHLPLFFIKFCVTIVNYFLKKRGHNLISLPNITCLGVNIFGVSTLYMIILVACSILSLIFRGYFYCLCLLFVVVDNDILKRVLRAVTRNGIALIWVGILGIIVLFIYAVISFAFLHNEFVGDLLYCTSLVECSYTVLRLGLLDSLGTAIPFSIVNFDLTANVSRLIFDLSFFVIVTTIGLNIVFGIIVDSFGELREERSNIEAEQKSKCFICDLPSYDFERRAEGFQNHVNCDHNMWDYVYYSLYIDSIDTGDHNAIQKYVHELIIDNDTGFFPQEEAICLTGEEDDTGEKLEELQGKVESILQQFRDKEYAKILQAKKQKQKEWEEKVRKQQPLQMLSPQMSMHMSPQQEHYY
jgi:inositol 1,4,5-triphosphate receptor type 1